ncbi:hypothetical protein GCM10022280_09560 [Sphingomonas swuensis]|uniref:Uncharacterized protein n=1 Tax=Sphingomonas swuensis TaxID=977800 RepID=A0ABP7SLM3_9SPHN
MASAAANYRLQLMSALGRFQVLFTKLKERPLTGAGIIRVSVRDGRIAAATASRTTFSRFQAESGRPVNH